MSIDDLDINQDRRVLDRMPYGVLVHAESGAIVYANAPAAELVGVAPDELVGRSLGSLFTPAFVSGLPALLGQEEALAGGHARLRERLVRADGVEVEVQIAATQYRAGGRPRVQLVLHDVGAELRVREEERQDAIASIAAGVAHELNNVLASIRAHASLLEAWAARQRTGQGVSAGGPEAARPEQAASEQLEVEPDAGALDGGPAGSEDVGADIEAIMEASRRGGRIAAQLLGFAGGGRYQPQVIEIGSLLHAAAGRARAEARHGITVAVEGLDAELYVRGDLRQLSNVLDALCDNALVAMQAGPGALLLRMMPSEPEAGQWVCIEVADDGPGMSAEVMRRAFEPYFSTRGMGRGLGLAMVHGVVARHGGTVRLESEVARGTRVRVLLPRVDQAREVARLGATPPSPPRGTVLVVDDEPLVRRATRRMLLRGGHDVLDAENGFAALAAVEAAGVWTLLCCIVDLEMPSMSGETLVQRLLAMRADLPIILATGYSDDERVARLLAIGRVGLLQKPFGIGELMAALALACGPIGAAKDRA